ncbi:MAG: glycosyltransferase family 2 protein [Gammaproteobacteria bacterium]|nr:glycosyltransferase family 2 protein [Gammaproteobacteria bacterium]
MENITPVILTFNEEKNITRTLKALSWAKDIVVVDSFSSDDTMRLLKEFKQVRVFQRSFDKHAIQWNFALTETAINTDWVLALDADYILQENISSEIEKLQPSKDIQGYEASFLYCIEGHPLRGSLYPPVTVLFRREKARYIQDGHTQRIKLEGKTKKLEHKIYHDDRKPLSHWLQAQDKYMRLEADIIRQSAWTQLSWPDKIRKLRFISPFMVFIYCLFIKRTVFDGLYGWQYAYQRCVAEMILMIHLLKK